MRVMKHMGLAVLLALPSLGMAQSSATAGIAANIVTPIGITKMTDMNFGNVAVSASSGGSVILSTAGTRTTGGTGVTLPANSGTVAPATFKVAGAPSFTYVITLPTSTIISDGSGHNMTVNSFVSNPSSTGVLGSAGTQNVNVSATMVVAAAQAPGIYTSATGVPVTVNYN